MIRYNGLTASMQLTLGTMAELMYRMKSIQIAVFVKTFLPSDHALPGKPLVTSLYIPHSDHVDYDNVHQCISVFVFKSSVIDSDKRIQLLSMSLRFDLAKLQCNSVKRCSLPAVKIAYAVYLMLYNLSRESLNSFYQ